MNIGKFEVKTTSDGWYDVILRLPDADTRFLRTFRPDQLRFAVRLVARLNDALSEFYCEFNPVPTECPKLDVSAVELRAFAAQSEYIIEDVDVFQALADEFRIPRRLVKDLCFSLVYSQRHTSKESAIEACRQAVRDATKLRS